MYRVQAHQLTDPLSADSPLLVVHLQVQDSAGNLSRQQCRRSPLTVFMAHRIFNFRRMPESDQIIHNCCFHLYNNRLIFPHSSQFFPTSQTILQDNNAIRQQIQRIKQNYRGIQSIVFVGTVGKGVTQVKVVLVLLFALYHWVSSVLGLPFHSYMVICVFNTPLFTLISQLFLNKITMKAVSNLTMTSLAPLDQDYSDWMHLEGECKAVQVTPLKRYHWTLMILITIAYGAVSCVLGLLALKYSVKFRAWLYYSQTDFLNSSHVLIQGNDETHEIEATFTDSNGTKVFFYRKLKYFKPDFYCPIGYSIEKEGHAFNEIFEKLGLDDQEVKQRRGVFGNCEHKVDVPQFFSYLFDQLLKGFFIMQYIVCATYIIEKNYMFAAIMLGFSIITTIINYIMLRLSYKKIKQIADQTHPVRVLRKGAQIEVDSSELVPGDLFFPDSVVPCDCVLVKGEIYVNEASLTGQNIPIGKFPPPDLERINNDTCWLFEGSKLLEARGDPMALVVNTGFATRKGRIFRKILSNKIEVPQFFASGLKYLMVMFGLGYVIFFAMIPVMLRNNISTMDIILRAFDIFGWTLPAALPIFFNLCYSFSLGRLRSAKIYGTEPHKTVISGKIKTMCFDKTGTLTMNSMELYCIHRVTSQNTCQETIAEQVKSKDASDILYKLFASCHTVRKIEDEFMGDELDLRMFLFSDFTFQLSDDVKVRFIVEKDGTRLEVLRINQFESKFQCMSVLVRDTKDNKIYAFVKGAPQKIQRCSVNKYNNYNKLIASLSLGGLRNISFGYKEVSPSNLDHYLKVDRSEYEKDLTLLGVVGFENKLKHDTVETIRILMEGGIEPKIITGDNIYIAVETAIRTNILPHGSKIILLEGTKQDNPIEAGGYHGVVLTHSKAEVNTEPIFLTFDDYLNQTLPIAIDNDFLKMREQPALPSTIKLFARISPESKALIVRRFRQIYKRIGSKAKVGMCGDGANDLMAIKEADVGMGISDTDSSFAANFAITELKGVELIVREGKATLMSLIEIFRYYGSSNFLKITSSMIMLYGSSYFTPYQIIFFNYTSTIWLALFLALSHPCDKLNDEVPDDNFLGLENFLVYNGNWAIPTVGLIICIVYGTAMPLFRFAKSATGTWMYATYSNTIVFICIELMFVCCIFWTYVGRPFKKPFYFNIYLTVLLVIDIAVSIAFYFVTPLRVFTMLKLETNQAGALLGITFAVLAVHGVYTLVLKLLKWTQ